MIFYSGPSAIDGEPIVAIITTGSKNQKTGPMNQLWIFTDNGKSPSENKKLGLDYSVCGPCPIRDACYVNLHYGPNKIYRHYLDGKYDNFDPMKIRGRATRLGAYGEATALSITHIERLVALSDGLSGYTHRWREIDSSWSKFLMASVENEADALLAQQMGYRTFRIKPKGGALMHKEVLCPAEKVGIQCIACKACAGTSSPNKASIAITVHGIAPKINAFMKLTNKEQHHGNHLPSQQ